jgi:uncharacterized protein DUF2845
MLPHPARLVLAACLALPLAAGADSLRCDGGIVSQGDSKLDLLGKCGAPALREAQGEERTRVRLDASGRAVAGHSSALTVERWTYNFGPRQFVQHVTLESGTVKAVERGGYGYELGERPEEVAIPRARCDQLAFRVGDTTFDLVARCGEPALRDVKVVTRTVSTPDGAGGSVATTITRTLEIWTYDLGPQTLVRRLIIDDGKVLRVDTGTYGYSRADGR